MATVRVQVDLPLDKLIEAVKQLSPGDLEQLASQVLAIQAQRRARSLSKEETSLLLKINNSGLPEEARERYRELIKKRQEETLTDEEYNELLRLSDESEQRQAERLEALMELARLRNTSLRELMDALGIKPAPVE